MSRKKKGWGAGRYRVHISWLGVLAIALLFVPNCIWRVVPNFNHPINMALLRNPQLETITAICEIAMLALLVIVVNLHWNKRPKRQGYLVVSIICLALYVASWALYYKGLYQSYMLIAMAVLPAIYLIFVDLRLKNHIALIPTAVYAVLHIVGLVLNYIG